MRKLQLLLFIFTFLGTPVLSHGAPQKQEFIPAGELMDTTAQFQFAIYYLPTPTQDPVQVLARQLAATPRGLRLVKVLPESPAEGVLAVRVETDVREKYPAPSLSALQYFGRGVDKAQAQALQGSAQVLVMSFAHPRQDVFLGMRNACVLVEQLARETGGLIWDEETREIFTPDAWHQQRLMSWEAGIPDVSKHTTIHAYKSNDFIRAISLGMAKFGLPDTVLDDFPWSSSGSVSGLIHTFNQVMLEGARVGTTGQYDLRVQDVRHAAVRDRVKAGFQQHATGVALLRLRSGVWEEGDPLNRLIEIGADRYALKDAHAQQQKMLSSFWGWESQVTPVNHTAALERASQQAKARLPILKAAFRAGLQPGESIQLKAPFASSGGGKEWMWVEVIVWGEGRVSGILRNEPYNIPSLHAGQQVEIRQEDIFDYLHRLPDGSETGNETGRIIMQTQAK